MLPFAWDCPPRARRQETWDADWANRHLAKWREMVGSTVEEMTRGWTEKVRVSGVEVSATLLDGKYLSEFSYMPPHMLLKGPSVRQHMTKSICESLDRWAGARGGQFDASGGSSYRLDDIVELAIRFTCTQWTYDVGVVGNRQRPFATKKTRREVATWNCFALLGGFENLDADSEPRAKRHAMKEVVRRNSRRGSRV